MTKSLFHAIQALVLLLASGVPLAVGGAASAVPTVAPAVTDETLRDVLKRVQAGDIVRNPRPAIGALPELIRRAERDRDIPFEEIVAARQTLAYARTYDNDAAGGIADLDRLAAELGARGGVEPLLNETLRRKITEVFKTDFPEVRGRVKQLPNGPPVPYPVQFRVSGLEVGKVRELADQVKDIMRQNPNTLGVNDNWNEYVKVLRLDLDQDKLRALGVTSQTLMRTANTILSGTTIGQFREGDKLIDIVMRQPVDERSSIELLNGTSVPTASGKAVTVSQLARAHFVWEPGVSGARTANGLSRYSPTSPRAYRGRPCRTRSIPSSMRCAPGCRPATVSNWPARSPTAARRSSPSPPTCRW